MPSPFPGIDPYLEHHWGDVHHRLITYAADQLQTRLPGGLRARVQERLVVPAPETQRPIYPYLRVLEKKMRGGKTRGSPVAVATAEPLIIELSSEPETQGFIEIRDRTAGDRVVTVLEILSPSNKTAGDGRNQYLKKQGEVIAGGISLVEIDLLRTGAWTLSMARGLIPGKLLTPMRVVVRRGWDPLRAEYYAISLREPLPVLRVPLREEDADAPLDLQALHDQCYENGGYDDIDYTREPEPPLDAADARRADRLLRSRGLRMRRGGRRN